jgi:phosphoribosyl-dephospho-CoA transferase
MAEHNSVTITINAPIPPNEEVAEVLGRHLWELASECEKAGWRATFHLTMTKEEGAGPRRE